MAEYQVRLVKAKQVPVKDSVEFVYTFEYRANRLGRIKELQVGDTAKVVIREVN